MSEEKKPHVVTPDGSLGILALGDIGIEKWRAVREAKKKTKDGGDNSETKK